MSGKMSETPYVETEILLAVMNEDEERARELVEGMLQGERIRFYQQLIEVRDLLREYGA